MTAIAERWVEAARRIIPGGVNSPIRAFKGLGLPPMVVEGGSGDTIWDVTGRRFIDYCCSWGPLICGHAHPAVVEALQRRIALGTSFGITTAEEVRLAEQLVAAVPSLEMVRFVSSGTEATMTALRIARGYTKRNYLIKFSGNYHGHSDAFLVQAGSGVLTNNCTASSDGIPDDHVRYTVSLPYNDLEAVCAAFAAPALQGQIAAVIVEPVAANMGVVPPAPGFLQGLRRLTSQHGALLIFDEVITGFRVAYGGAQQLYGVEADLCTYGKIIGGGMPAAAVGGRRAIMQVLAPLGAVYQAGTLSGNPVAMTAGLQTLALLQRPGVYEELEGKTRLITDAVEELIGAERWPVALQRVGSLFTIFFGKRAVRNMDDAKQLDGERFAAFFRHLYQRGIYAPPSQNEAWFVSLAHSDANLRATRDAILEFLQEQDW